MNNKTSNDYERQINIFELLKDIKSCETNKQLISYFKFVKFYGLLDPLNLSIYEEALKIKQDREIAQFKLIIIFTSIGFLLYRNRYKNFSLLFMNTGLTYCFYSEYEKNQELNFVLLKMKEDYLEKVEKFFKDEKNPLNLNPNFLNENLIDPNLRRYQEIIKLQSNRLI